MNESLKGKRILVTGACGTVGTELIRQLLLDRKYSPAEVVGIDNSENHLFFLDQEWRDEPRAQFFFADVRDVAALRKCMTGIDIVFHTAALKHVILCERSPDEAVLTNILGIQNMIHVAIESGIEKMVFTSSDKAVNPTNVMGTSKLMGERLITAANNRVSGKGPVFSSTRFGNVLGSNGSVVPIFHTQIMKGGPVTLTDRAMTRFVMTIEQAVQLIIDSACLAKGGEVFITKMPIIRIEDLAKVMISALAEKYGHQSEAIDITEIGTKPGEKLYEELMSDEEKRRSIELDNYFVVLPAFRGIYHEIDYSYPGTIRTEIKNSYISTAQDAMPNQELAAYLENNNLLTSPEVAIERRYWPGDK